MSNPALMEGSTSGKIDDILAVPLISISFFALLMLLLNLSLSKRLRKISE